MRLSYAQPPKASLVDEDATKIFMQLAIETLKIKSVKAREETAALTKDVSLSDVHHSTSKVLIPAESAAWAAKGGAPVTDRTNADYALTTSATMNPKSRMVRRSVALAAGGGGSSVEGMEVTGDAALADLLASGSVEGADQDNSMDDIEQMRWEK